MKALQEAIDDYQNISVPFNQMKIRDDKHRAFQQRSAELAQKFENVNNDIRLKMKQHLDMAMNRKNTLMSHKSSFGPRNDSVDNEAS